MTEPRHSTLAGRVAKIDNPWAKRLVLFLACQHPQTLRGGSLERSPSEVETGVTTLFRERVEAFKTRDAEFWLSAL